MSDSWKQIENEAGYPYFVNEVTKDGQYDHPQFEKLLRKLEKYKKIKYATYRMAYKIFDLQNELKVPPIKLTSGVMARHCLSISESSITLEPSDLEAILTDIYFVAEKEGLFKDDISLMVQLLLNLILNTFDPNRNSPVKVQSAKCLLVLLSMDPWNIKRQALLQLCGDHDALVTPKRLGVTLTCAGELATALGDHTLGTHLVNQQVQQCFHKSPGMLGLSEYAVQQWFDSEPTPPLLSWVPVIDRIRENTSQNSQKKKWLKKCSACNSEMNKSLKFVCTKCVNVFLCERCYLYDDNNLALTINRHEKTHLVNEVIGDEPPLKQSKVNIRNIKKLFMCSKSRKKHQSKGAPIEENMDKENKPGIYTSTVGKASGSKTRPMGIILNDIIANLEQQNRALKDLSKELSKEDGKSAVDKNVRCQVEKQWAEISTQIQRLKLLQDNLSTSNACLSKMCREDVEKNRMKSFDMFSPIPNINEKGQKIKGNPRILNVDSGNFSSNDLLQETTRNGGGEGRALFNNLDSLSAVSVGDISTWLANGAESSSQTSSDTPTSARSNELKLPTSSVQECEMKYAADMNSIAASNDKVKEANASLDCALEKLQRILASSFTLDESTIDNTQLKERASEMEDLLGTLIRGVEKRRTHTAV